MTSNEFSNRIVTIMQTLYRVSYSQLSQKCDRDDAVQECLLKAWCKHNQGLHLDDPTTPDNALISMPNLHVHINMVDGSVVEIMLGWISMDAETRRFTEGRHIEAGFIDLNSVVSIEINGEVIEFR